MNNKNLAFTDRFLFNDLKYLMAYSIPLTTVFGFHFGGYWLWTTTIYVFLIIPILELILTYFKIDESEKVREEKSVHWIFDFMLYLNIPVVFGILFFCLSQIKYYDYFSFEFLAGVLSMGLVVVSNGINVAHELCHRQETFEKYLGKFLLIPSLYMHFYLEHNFGHHLKVATFEDPVSARYNQPVYLFWITAIIGELMGAIDIQKRRLEKQKFSFFSIYNDMFWYIIIQLFYLTLIFVIYSLKGLFFVLFVAITAILIYETINYIEHYGLLREKLSSGRYDRVREIHSWNSNHIIGRIVLYELTRHSDHHRISVTKFQNLKSLDESPQLPYGYPTSIFLSLFPFIWFRLMNSRVPKNMIESAIKN